MKLAFVSTKGVVRGAMAKAITSKMARLALLSMDIYLAGTEPAEEVPPKVLQVLKEKEYPTENLVPIPISQLPYDDLDILITLSPEARDRCPYSPAHKRREHWVIEEASPEDVTELRKLRDKLETAVKELLKIK
ncbi:Protein-tyrosine phosphatase, low molecular weight [Thermocrinis albus DSM 14484]|uniref:Protein-tyrosine phosphatase, low molecular weight n=1 Tax=Thermocrinis albus (strain DSM 14484 / JCM 11386 / HI 11/12) TaxID=638303 RepID=D3SPZ3_THEAH|nr:low molecular weight phosphatase family protein [Thermocrinis albus]ADC89230.1 Protein-tyrosine phosphatase, low molecular weight [Thermocrinis albus DSM 14484]